MALAVIAALCFAGCRTWFREMPAGFVVPPCNAPAKMVFVCEKDGWAEQVMRLPCFGRGRTVAVPAFIPAGTTATEMSTPWTTDEWIFGYWGGRLSALQIPGERGLSRWGVEYFNRHHGWQRIVVGWGGESPGSRFTAGGNIIASPPVPGRFPHGRIIAGEQMQPQLLDFFRQQRVQTGPDGKLIELPTDWLKVGHVDEIVGFVPFRAATPARRASDGSAGPADAGFRLVLPDPEAGIRLLASVPADRVLFAAENGRQVIGTATSGGARFIEDLARDFTGGKWSYVRIISGKGAGVVGRVWKPAGHRLLIDQSWNLQGECLGLATRAAREGRADNMPIWFEIPDGTSRYVAVEDSCMWLDGAGDEFPALITAGELASDAGLLAAATNCAKRIYGPGGVREVVSRGLGLREEDAIRLPVLWSGNPDGTDIAPLVPNPVNLVCLGEEVVLLEPHGPRLKPEDESSDVFLCAWKEAMERAGVRAVFLDGWNALHRLDGGARCGMNVLRK